MFCLLVLVAATLITGLAVSDAAEGGNAASVKSGSAATVQGKVPFPRPDSHRGNWIVYHGAASDLNLSDARQSDKSCMVCHERNDCITCHTTQMPRDHTNTWRTLSHGFMAGGNRERCLACHRQDYCVRCHNETAPRSHVGNWLSTHCAWCHFSGGSRVPADNCVVCHKTAH